MIVIVGDILNPKIARLACKKFNMQHCNLFPESTVHPKFHAKLAIEKLDLSKLVPQLILTHSEKFVAELKCWSDNYRIYEYKDEKFNDITGRPANYTFV